MKIVMNMLTGLILCLPLLAQAEENHPVIQLDGFSTLKTFDRGRRVKQQEPPQRFSAWLSGCKWAVYLIGDTNEPNGITQVTCDGTNVYVFVPDASGTTMVGTNLEPFLQSGAVYPGTIKLFPYSMGPIWWAYCSACETDAGKETIPDFMNLLGQGLNRQLRINGNSRKVETRIGPNEERLSSTSNSAALAIIKPEEVSKTNGILLVRSCNVVIYDASTLSNSAPQPSLEYSLTISRFYLVTNSALFIPQITSQSLVTDYRTPYSGEYRANHWLDVKERKAVFRTPVIPRTVSASSALAIIRIILISVAVLPIAFLLISRLRQARRQANKNT